MNALRPADPIEDYVLTLAAALHGPARVKARLVKEIHDGLTDTAAAYTGDGMPYQHAAHQAVREFGSADDLVPDCQRELTIAQTRHTARVAALTVPFLVGCWFLTWTAGQDGGWQLRLLGVHLAGVAAIAGLLAAATLAATGGLARWLPTPHRLPLAVAWTGTAAGVAMAIATLGLAVAAALATNWMLMVIAGALAAASHAVVAAASRACRQCARLPDTA